LGGGEGGWGLGFKVLLIRVCVSGFSCEGSLWVCRVGVFCVVELWIAGASCCLFRLGGSMAAEVAAASAATSAIVSTTIPKHKYALGCCTNSLLPKKSKTSMTLLSDSCPMKN